MIYFIIYQCGNIPISRQLHGYFLKVNEHGVGKVKKYELFFQ